VSSDFVYKVRLNIFLILGRSERDFITMCIGLHVNYLLFLPDFNENLIFSTHFRKISNFTKILPVGVELFHENGQTDRQHEANIVVFRNFANAPKNHTVT
jgi:hypothetical protein